MVENCPRKNEVKARIGEGQLFRKVLNDLYVKFGFGRKSSDCTSSHDCARIGLESCDLESLTCQCIARYASSCSNVQGLPLPGRQQPRHFLPLRGFVVTLSRRNERIIVEGIQNKLLLPRLLAKPTHCIFPGALGNRVHEVEIILRSILEIESIGAVCYTRFGPCCCRPEQSTRPNPARTEVDGPDQESDRAKNRSPWSYHR